MFFNGNIQEKEEKRLENYRKTVSAMLSPIIKMADEGNLDCLVFLANHYLSESTLDRNPELGFSYYQKAKALNWPDADFHLGLCYLKGEGVKKDVDSAIDCFREAIHAASGYSSHAYLYLIDIYMTYENHIDYHKAERIYQEYLKTGIEGIKSTLNSQLDDKQFPSEAHFRYAYQENEETKERSLVLIDAYQSLNAEEPKTAFLDEDFLKKSVYGNIYASYLYLIGKGFEKDIDKAIERLHYGFHLFLKKSKVMMASSTIPCFVPYYFDLEEGMPLSPYGYLMDEEESKDYLSEMEGKAGFNVPEAVFFCGLAYYGKYKYLKKDIYKSKEYFLQARDLKIPEASIYLAVIYHDGLDDGIVDKTKANRFLSEVKDAFDAANLLLAYYALVDDKDEKKAYDYLLFFATEEEKEDEELLKSQANVDIEKLEDEETRQYLLTSRKGVEAVKRGIQAYEEKDYETSIKEFNLSAIDYEMTEGSAWVILSYLVGAGVEKDLDKVKAMIQEVLFVDIL